MINMINEIKPEQVIEEIDLLKQIRKEVAENLKAQLIEGNIEFAEENDFITILSRPTRGVIYIKLNKIKKGIQEFLLDKMTVNGFKERELGTGISTRICENDIKVVRAHGQGTFIAYGCTPIVRGNYWISCAYVKRIDAI